ncbi:hypothetical protein PAHAL_5G479500 [Panicum hallii]|uniref:Uncharacterized protein n=1 Tax=Panicum hallii TaxID=206008 RepID=A0A2S3HXX8_9POAL|nr:hypothetical protein PAHAL_5G479500 [Panicum hallii]
MARAAPTFATFRASSTPSRRAVKWSPSSKPSTPGRAGTAASRLSAVRRWPQHRTTPRRRTLPRRNPWRSGTGSERAARGGRRRPGCAGRRQAAPRTAKSSIASIEHKARASRRGRRTRPRSSRPRTSRASATCPGNARRGRSGVPPRPNAAGPAPSVAPPSLSLSLARARARWLFDCLVLGIACSEIASLAAWPERSSRIRDGESARERQTDLDGERSSRISHGESAGSAPPQQRKKDWTPEERNAAAEFIRALIEDYNVYAAMTEDDVEEEYRRAGKLDKYDPERELQKRGARVAKEHPPPAGFYPKLEQYFKLGDDAED